MELVWLWLFLCVSVTHSELDRPVPPLDPEVHMNISEIIRWWGYPAEDHEVETEDGYILSLNRIPHSSGGRSGVVLLQHGLLATGSTWVLDPPDSLGFFLSQNGFDVWIANSRGNTWSRRHRHLTPDQEEFWAFSHDEMALKDLPAVIDYVLNTTQQQQLSYIGHSQGTTIGFMLFSSRPDLSEKVKLFVALAPVATIGFIKSPMTKLAKIAEPTIWLMFRRRDFLPESHIESIEWFAEDFCTEHSLCRSLFFVIQGFNEHNLNMTLTLVYANRGHGGTSVQNMVHWAQAVKGKKLSAFNYGPKGNMQHYNQTSPPEYDIQKMKVPTAVFSGGRDDLADPEDVSLLLPKITNLVFHLTLDDWEHLDFTCGLDAKERMFPEILKLLQTH